MQVIIDAGAEAQPIISSNADLMKCLMKIHEMLDGIEKRLSTLESLEKKG
jgi:hypothetical protein